LPRVGGKVESDSGLPSDEVHPRNPVSTNLKSAVSDPG